MTLVALGATYLNHKESYINYRLGLTLGIASITGGLFGMYYFGKKFAQQFDWFKDKTVKKQEQTNSN